MRGQKTLLGKRIGAHGEGYYAAPGGHVEFGESLAETAAREVMEECGLRIEKIRLLSVGTYMWGKDKHYIDVDVVCEASEGEPQNREPENCAGWAWYDLDNLPAPLFIVTDTMIKALRSGKIMPDVGMIYRQAMVAP